MVPDCPENMLVENRLSAHDCANLDSNALPVQQYRWSAGRESLSAYFRTIPSSCFSFTSRLEVRPRTKAISTSHATARIVSIHTHSVDFFSMTIIFTTTDVACQRKQEYKVPAPARDYLSTC